MKKRYLDTKYIIYDDGRCYSELSNKFLTPQMSITYPSYNLTIDGKKKKVKVHRMVAEAFLPKEEGKNIVNHKDGNTKNFNVSNLEWTDEKGNSKHALETGLKPRYSSTPANFYEGDYENERWTDIKDFSLYLISSIGRVMNKDTKRLLKPYESNIGGYYTVNLWKNGKGTNIRVHQLVYSNFTQDYDMEGYVINHKDGDKHNNNIENLEKITYQENNFHAEYCIKTHNCAKPVIQLDMDGKTVAEFSSIREAERLNNLSNISRAIAKHYKTGGYYWKFK